MTNFQVTSEGWVHKCGGGIKPINVAAANKETGALNWLLQTGGVSGIDVQSTYGLSAFLVACKAGHEEHCETLISHDALITKADTLGITLFMASCYGGHTHICRYLSSIDETLISAEAAGMIPIEVAVECGDASPVRFLLKKKCEIKLSAQAKALQHGHGGIANLISEKYKRRGYRYGSRMQEKAKLNKLRLQSACKGDDEQALISLLSERVDSNTRLELDHETPLHAACFYG